MRMDQHIFDSVKHSLERLQLDYIDVLQCHRFDKDTPIEETVRPRPLRCDTHLHSSADGGFARRCQSRLGPLYRHVVLLGVSV